MKNKNKKVEQLIYIFLILQPILDLSTSLMVRYSDFVFTIGMVARGLFLVFIGVYFLIYSNSSHKKKSIIYFIILFAFCLLYFITKPDIFTLSFLKTELTYLFKFMYFPIVTICFINIYDELSLKKEKIFKICLFNIIVYSIFILVPEITGTSFNSYLDSSKGSVGWFFAANEIGAIVVALFPYAYYMLFERMSISKIILVFIIIITAMTLLGTKTSFLGMVITEFVYLVYFLFNSKKNRALGLKTCICIIIVSIFLIPRIPAIKNLQTAINNDDEQIVEEDDSISEDRYNFNPSTQKLFSIIFSGRQNFFFEALDIYNYSKPVDKFFGIGFSNRETINDGGIEKLIEIDLFDVFFHYGLLGFIIYFGPLVYICFRVIKLIFQSKFTFTFFKLTNIYIIGIVTMISMIAGHVYGAPSVSIYVAISIAMLESAITKIEFPVDNSNRKKKVTIFALHLGYGGVEKYLSSLCKMLKEDYEIEIISTYKVLDKPAFEIPSKVKITYLINDKPNKKEFKNAVKNKQIIKIFKEGFKSLKILYLKRSRNIKAIRNTYSDYIITTRIFHNNLVGYYGYYDITKIATEHNFHNDDKKYIRSVVNSLKGFDYFAVVSNNLKEFYEGKIGKTKCVYIPNVIDSLPSKKTNLKGNNIITIGRLSEEKGQKDLIDVVNIVKEEISDIKLFLVGDGPLKESLEEYVRELDLTKNIIFTGFLDKKGKEKYIMDSSIFVLPSYTESFGLVLIEAMSYGLPCIAFDSSDGAKELLKDDIGVLIENRDKNLMAKEIINLINNKQKLNEYSKKEYKYCQRYLLSNVKNEWLNLLKGVEE